MEIEPALSLVPAPQMVVIVPLVLNQKMDVEIKMIKLIKAIYHHNRITISFSRLYV